MRLLPTRKFLIQTSLEPAEALVRLQRAVGPRRWFSFGASGRTFEGTIQGSRFEVQRIILYRNSFRPRIVGSIERTASGAQLVGTMGLEPLAAVFMALWFGALLVGGGVFLVKGPRDAASLFPFGMILFGYLIVTFSFEFEARRSRDALATVVSATHVELT